MFADVFRWLVEPGSRSYVGDSIGWLFGKTAVFMLLFLWFRATFPRYRYDQIMRLGWKVLLPVTIIWIVVEGCHGVLRSRPWFG